MRILLITPSYFPKITGNSVDVARIKEGLVRKGHHAKVILSSKIPKKIARFDLIHAFHSYKSRAVAKLDIPYIITMPGTDYNVDMKNSAKQKIICRVLKKAKFITVLNKESKKAVGKICPKLSKKIRIVRRQRPKLPNTNFNLRKKYGISKVTKVITIIGGIRPVKNQLFPINPLTKLQKRFDFHLLYVGPKLDPKYFAKFQQKIKNKSWIKYIGEILPKDIKSVYDGSDIILNCSHSEGGSNVIFEGLYCNKLILASDIAGNKSYSSKKITFFKHDDLGDFLVKAEKLLNLKTKYNQNKSELSKNTNDKEIDDYINIYKKILG